MKTIADIFELIPNELRAFILIVMVSTAVFAISVVLIVYEKFMKRRQRKALERKDGL